MLAIYEPTAGPNMHFSRITLKAVPGIPRVDRN